MCSVVEDDAVLEYFADAGSLVVVGCFENFDCAWCIGCDGACKEASACSEAEFNWIERVFDCSVRARLADKSAWRGRGVLSLCEAVDAVVEQNHVQIDITADGVDEVIATDGEAVAVAADLPDGEGGVGDLGAGADGSGTAVDGLHGVGVHVVGQTAGAADAADDGGVVGSNANLGHGLVQRGKEEMVTAARAPAGLPLLEIVGSVWHDVDNDESRFALRKTKNERLKTKEK